MIARPETHLYQRQERNKTRGDRFLTSSLPSALSGRRLRGDGWDSFYKTATSRRENVTSRVSVPIMSRTTNKTGPFSHSKTFPASRASAAGAQLVGGKPETVPEREPATLEKDLPVGISDGTGFKGNPPERAASTTAYAPAQLGLAMLMPTRHVLFGHLLENGRANRQPLAARPVEIPLKLMRPDEPVLPPQHLQGEIVAVIPHEIHRARHLREHLGMLVPDAESEDPDWSLAAAHTVQIYRFYE